MAFSLTSRPVAVMDTECYINYWSIGFRSIIDGRTKVYELFDGNPLDRKAIAKIMRMWTVVGFNSNGYDIPMILLAMSGASTEELKAASDQIIQFNMPPWTFMDRYGLSIPDFIDSIDLMQVSPGAAAMPSLKIHAGRLHSRTMQELPFDHNDEIDDLKRQVLRDYHGNDLDVTLDMYRDLLAQLAIRDHMSVQYGIDLRSKSDAQIAEAVLKLEIEKLTGKRLYKPDIAPGYFSYEVPEFIKFTTSQMQTVLDGVRNTKFVVDAGGIVQMPAYLKGLRIAIGGSTYQMGLGGLHSCESGVSHYSDDEHVLLDRDVTSYYPSIILRCGLYPRNTGPAFLDVYRTVFDRRLAAKKSGQKAQSDTLKIVLNGSFGKLGSPYSVLYSPNLMVQVTMTGQLSILMLIEELQRAGFSVVSGNTDGVVTKVRRDNRDEFNAICNQWEKTTGFSLEETEYGALHSKDVNNYIAITGGNVKTKGEYGPSGAGLPGAMGQKKNPQMQVCTDAVVNYLLTGESIEDHIEWEFDLRKFVTVRKVGKGGTKTMLATAMPTRENGTLEYSEFENKVTLSNKAGAIDQDGNYIGKALRWYYSKNVTGCFKYANNGNSVPQSHGAKLMMTLRNTVPAGLDHDYYIREAYAMLQDLGVQETDPALRGRTGLLVARHPDQKTYHLVNASTGVALCGKRRASVRDSWQEVAAQPDGRGMCTKCKKADEL